jgi:hypothetical protein
LKTDVFWVSSFSPFLFFLFLYYTEHARCLMCAGSLALSLHCGTLFLSLCHSLTLCALSFSLSFSCSHLLCRPASALLFVMNCLFLRGHLTDLFFFTCTYKQLRKDLREQIHSHSSPNAHKRDTLGRQTLLTTRTMIHTLSR